MDFLEGIFIASFGGINSRIEADEIERLKAAFDDLQIAAQKNSVSQSVKYIRKNSYYLYSSGYIIEKKTPKTVILRAYNDGRCLENITEEQRREYYEPHKKVMTIEDKDIRTGHSALTIAAYEKALTTYNELKRTTNEKIKNRFSREIISTIYHSTGIYLHT